MNQLSLTLTPYPYTKPPVNINLTSGINSKSSIEEIIESSEKVFSDLSYTAKIEGIDVNPVKQLLFYVNGCLESCQFSGGLIRFPSKDTAGDRRIFLDCFGFVEIAIVLKYENGDSVHLRSEYLSVLVRKGALNESVKAMASYVHDNQQDLLFNGETKPKSIANLKENGFKSLESQILLAKEIAELYEGSFGYFKANCRFKSEPRNIIDSFEKLQCITSHTIQYIAQHPEQLKQVTGTNGIKCHYRTYQPIKTLTRQNVYSFDIYENRVIVFFIKKMITSMKELLSQIETMLSKLPSEEIESGDYVYSSYFIFSSTKKILSDNFILIMSLLKRFERLWGLYSRLIKVTEIQLHTAPKPSAIFLSVPQYNKIFTRMNQWYTFGIYDFAAEQFMLSFIKISSLYESYILTKLIGYFKSRGFTLLDQTCITYPVREHWKYKNTSCYNTFTFKSERQILTLYYQPVIFDSDKRTVNNIGLYRNNSISLDSDEEDVRRGHYYVPDFIIKTDRNNQTKYIICDAKFSSLSTIKNYYLSDLAYKYLFSISPIGNSESIAGLCVFYGQCEPGCDSQTAYDRQLADRRITPFAEFVPIMELINQENHFDLISDTLSLI